jgi:hypothetical protein
MLANETFIILWGGNTLQNGLKLYLIEIQFKNTGR